MSGREKSLYERLGGYDAIAAVAADLLGRLRQDPQLGRFWANRSTYGLNRELQLLIEFVCSRAGGPVFYTGREVPTVHHGMRISESDWSLFIGHVDATLKKFDVPEGEHHEVVGFLESFKKDIVE